MKTTEPRKYKKHTLIRRKEAKKNNFLALDFPGKVAMIKRQRRPAEGFQLWLQLSNEEKLQFIRENYKGFKVDWQWVERQGMTLAPVRIHRLGWTLTARPMLGKFRVSVDLVRLSEYSKPGDEYTLTTIQRYLPTVKAL